MDLTCKYLLYLYILLVPLMKLPKLPFMGDKMQYCDLLFVPLFIIFIIGVVKNRSRMIIDKIGLFLIVLAFVSGLSLFNSLYKKEIYWDTFGMFYLIAAYFVITNLIKDRKTLSRINVILSISVVLVSLSGIVFFILYNFFNMKSLAAFMYANVSDTQTLLLPFCRSASLLTLPEMFVNFSLLGLVCLFILRNKQQGNKGRTITNLSVAVVILAVCLAFGRSVIGLMLLFSAITFRFRGESLILYCCFLVCIILFIFLFLSAAILWFYTVAPVSFSIDNNSGIAHLSFNTKWDTRYYLAKAGLAMGNTHPWLGSGLDSFTNHFSAFLSQEDLYALAVRRNESAQLLRIDPHSLYFGAIAEIGWLGVFILLSFFFFVLIKLWKKSRSEYACYVFFFAIMGYLINGLFVDVLSIRSLWIALSLGVVYANLSKEEPKKHDISYLGNL